MNNRNLKSLAEDKAGCTISLGEGYTVQIYDSGMVCNFLVHDRAIVQIRYIDPDIMNVHRVVMMIPRSDIVKDTKDNLLVYLHNYSEFIHDAPYMTCTLDEDITILSDIVPTKFLFLLREYKPRKSRNHFTNYLYRLLEA